ncbi:MAG: ElyC/SanA/YdcF family protein, partial [Desulfuromonadales bacterium]
LSATGLVRLDEGIRLYRQLPAARLVLSGGPVYGSDTMAEGYARAALALGVPASALVKLDTPRDTAEEARAVRKLLGVGRPFLLVTSASHMPRAMRLFQRGGLKPIPAPTRHESLRENRSRFRYLVPSAQQLRKTERAFHEYVGMLAVGFDH